jgi:hypothetical protein
MKPKKMFAFVFSAVLMLVLIIGSASAIVNKNVFSHNIPFQSFLSSLKMSFFDIFGINEYNGVYISNDSLIEVNGSVNDVCTLENIQAIKTLGETSNVPVYFSLVPTSEYVNRLSLERKSLVWDQGKYIEDVYYRLVEDVSVVDVAETIYNFSNDDLYFKTSNKLSPLGGYHVFQTMMKRLDYQVMELQKYDVEYHTDSFYGELAHKLKNYSVSDKIEFYRYPFYKRNITTNITDKNGNKRSYNDVYISQNTGFNTYLGGQNPLTTIHNTETFSEKLLIISDWTFNVTAGFFVDYFEEITFINPLEYNENIQKIQPNDYNYVIVMFSVDNFNNANLSHIKDILE